MVKFSYGDGVYNDYSRIPTPNNDAGIICVLYGVLDFVC